MKNLIKILFCICICNYTYAQNFDLRFNLSSIDCNSQIACYDVQVRSINGNSFNLAGQNYRIYYNNDLADYNSGSSQLSSSAYGGFTVVQDLGPADASVFSSNLGFESTLGFLNYQIDLNDLVNGGVVIPANGQWVTTSNLCFSVSSSVIQDNSGCIELVWAKDGYTNSLATAFNEISQWVDINDTDPVLPTPATTHDDLDDGDGDQACFNISCGVPDPDPRFDISTEIQSVDCDNSQICYAVRLKSSNNESFQLAGQNYRLYYDNSIGDYVSGFSVLPASYSSYTVVSDSGPFDASASSSILGFESNLGFLNYTMDLNDVQNGGNFLIDQSWRTTSVLCFEINEESFLDDNTCFDAVWARDGLTNTIATAFVEVAEWKASNDTDPVIGQSYEDIPGSTTCVFDQCSGPDISIVDLEFDETAGIVSTAVCLSRVSNADLTLDVSFSSSTAQINSDFSASSTSVTIPAGSLCADITYTIIDDTISENDEFFFINLSNPGFGQIIDDMATVKILDNDQACNAIAPQLSR